MCCYLLYCKVNLSFEFNNSKNVKDLASTVWFIEFASCFSNVNIGYKKAITHVCTLYQHHRSFLNALWDCL